MVVAPFSPSRIGLNAFGKRLLINFRADKIQSFESLPLRQNVVSANIKRQNQILVCKHSVNNPEDKLFGFNRSDIDHWQFPQGGQDGNEELAQTGIKECQEEVGLTKIKFIASSQTHSTTTSTPAARS